MIRRTDAEMRLLIRQHRARVLNASITPGVLNARGYRTVRTKAELRGLGFSVVQCRVPALLLPIHGVSGEIVSYQIRPDEPRIGKDGKVLKYEMPAGSRMALDVHPFIHQHLCNPKVSLWITEGILKADAAVSAGLCCVAVLGVWNWRGTNEHGGKTALPEWEVIALNGRQVYIAFDSDVMTKPSVHDALARLGAFLASRGAQILYVYLPAGPGGTKTGLDDYLAAGHTIAELLTLATSELRRPQPDTALAEQPYVIAEAGTIWRRPTPDGTIEISLANFSAVIIGDVVEDDGAEERRVYRLVATVRGKKQEIQIPAQQFAGMGWIGERLGASAVLEPGLGTKERLRHAIQILSGEVPLRRVYTHTGWRLIDGIWVYLHGAGAIGPDGPVTGIDIELRGPLGRFALPDPPSGDVLLDAVRAALNLIALLPPEAAYPLLGAAWLAPLRALLGAEAPDFVLWLHGPSGTFKSECLALAQAFFGDFTRQSLPANFNATPNALERFLFEAKDALLAVDDYHPAGGARELQAMDQVANRLLRGAGNLAGRARMRADTTLRPALEPRTLAIASGERLPEGHSTIARMFPIAVTPGSIDSASLTLAQEHRHCYALAMAGYIEVLARQFEFFQETLPSRFLTLRTELQRAGGHRREHGQLAHLLLGLETLLDFAVEIGAITADIRVVHLQQAQQVLLAHAREHVAAHADEVPDQLFLRYLAGGFAGKQAYLEAKQGGAPHDPALWGWEPRSQRDSYGSSQEAWRHAAAAQLVGVLDGEWLLLYPEQVYQFVVGAAKAAGRVFPVDQNTLIRRLDEAGLIATEMEGRDRRRKVNVWINGASKRVVKLRRDTVLSLPGVQDREDREGREDRPHSDGTGEVVPSDAPRHQEAIGAVSTGNGARRQSCLPGLPALPGPCEEERTDLTEHEEIVEWRA